MVICFALLFALGQLQPQSHASVEGQVVRQGNADPIVRARLLLAKVGGGLQDYATRLSDGAGRFAFRDLTPGTYRLYADRDGYPPTEYEGRITLVGGQDLKDVVLKMIPYGVITGRVFDANHNPVRH